MFDYKEMYLHLFRKITIIIEELKATQQEAEEMFISFDESDSENTEK